MNSPDQTPRGPNNRRRRRSPFETRAPDEISPDSEIWDGFLGGVRNEPRMMWGIGSLAIWLLISGAVWLFNNLAWPSYYLVRALDIATGAAALPAAPFLMWTLWGAIFGGLLGNWLLAPLYGAREGRSMPLYLALVAMGLIAVLLWAFVR